MNDHNALMQRALVGAKSKTTWKEAMKGELKTMYYYEKIMGQRIDRKFPAMKLVHFAELVMEDPEFKPR